MSILADFTLIIPTHNRPEKIKFLVNLLSNYKDEFNVIFLDSSENSIKQQNKKLISSHFINNKIKYSYYEFDITHEPFEKFYFGLSQVKTNYCSFCADDDVVFLECVEEIIEFLNLNSDYSAAHGYYFSFQFDQDEIAVQDVVYYKNNLYHDKWGERVHSLFSNYEATFYATYRTEALKDFFSLAFIANTALWKELILALASVMSGKIYRIPTFYYGRRVGQSLPFKNWHPHEIFSTKPHLYFTDYLNCRTALIDHFSVTKNITESEEKFFDLSHLFYLKNYLEPAKLESLCNEDYEKSPSVEGFFYKTQTKQANLLQKNYKNRRKTKRTLRVALSMILRELLLPLGYIMFQRFGFLKPIMKKIGEWVFPNIIITTLADKRLSIPYSFGNEFFLRNLPRGHRPNTKDVSLIVSNMEKYTGHTHYEEL